MKGRYFSLYLNEKRKTFVETLPDGLAPYVNKKIDDDIEQFDPTHCEQQISFWKKQKKLAMKRRK